MNIMISGRQCGKTSEYLRKIDALVAEHVMGFNDKVYQASRSLSKTHTVMSQLTIPHYSTDISAAWEVVEKLFDGGFDTEIQVYLTDENKRLHRVVLNESKRQENAFCEFAESAQQAICLAALRAKGISVHADTNESNPTLR